MYTWAYALLLPAGAQLLASADATVNLTGVGATGAAGAAIARVDPALTGVAGAGSAGDVAKTVGPAVTGVQGAGAAGDFAKTATPPTLTGVAGTGSAGSFTPNVQPALAGVAGTGAAGDVTAQVTALSNLSGLEAIGTIGGFGFGVDAPLPGVVGVGEAGSFPEPLEPHLVGVPASGQAGNIKASVLGWSFTPRDRGELWRPIDDQGPEDWNPQPPDTLDVWVSNSKSKAMAGVQARGEVGTIGVEVEEAENPTISKAVTGVAATGGVGNLTASVRKDGVGVMTSVQALGRAGAIGVQVQSSPPTIRPKLTWNPADVAPLNSPTVVDIPITGLTRTFGASEDVLLRAPAAKITGKVGITGGRNIQLIGGAAEMVNDGQTAPGGAIDLNFAHQFAFNDFTGALFLQGLELDRKGSVGSGLWYASAAEGTGNVYIQDCRILNINGIDGAGNLIGNAIVTAGPYNTVNIDRLTFSTQNVGLYLVTRLHWTGSGSAIRVKNVNGYVLTPGNNVTSVRMLTLRESCTAGTNDSGVDLTTPITLDECYVELGTSGQAFIDTVVPNAPAHGACGATLVTSTTPDTLDWPASANIAGVVKLGVPAAGDFVPAGAAGLNYVSPGYLPTETSTTIKPIYYNGTITAVSASVLAAYNMKKSTYVSMNAIDFYVPAGETGTTPYRDGVFDGTGTANWDSNGYGMDRVTSAHDGMPVSLDWEATAQNSGCTGNFARDIGGFGSAACQDKAEAEGIRVLDASRAARPNALWGMYDVPRSNEPGSFLAPSASFMNQVNVISASFWSRSQVIHQRCYVTYRRVSSGGDPLGADTATVAQVKTMLENMAQLGHECADKATTVAGTPRPLVIPYCSVEYFNSGLGSLHNSYVQDMEWLYYWTYYYCNYVHTNGRKADGVYIWTRSSAPINSEAQIKAIYQAVNGLPFDPNMPRPNPPT